MKSKKIKHKGDICMEKVLIEDHMRQRENRKAVNLGNTGNH